MSAMLDKSGVEALRVKALQYVNSVGNGHAFCRWFYRNQSQEYFDDILSSDGVMRTHIKDFTGDPGSPINGRLSGLFFTATVAFNSKVGQPVSISPFGPVRLLVPALDLLAKAPNVYFADFYCMPTSQYHYVTIVLTVPNSDADKFCATHLVRLSIKKNPFLFENESGHLLVTTADKLFVEVFYTEDLEIEGSDLGPCKTIKQGHTTPGGVPKDRSCKICNLR